MRRAKSGEGQKPDSSGQIGSGKEFVLSAKWSWRRICKPEGWRNLYFIYLFIYLLFIYLFFSFLFFSFFFFISWRLITSQHFSGFCHTLTWISHGFTCILHPDPPSPSLSTRFLWVFPVHQARARVSCIPPGLVICFTIDNIHAVLSKYPTLAFSHRVQKSVLYVCVSFSVLHIGLSLLSF